MVSYFALGLTIIGTILGAIGALFVKRGSADFSLKRVWQQCKNFPLIFGGILYFASSVLYITALRHEHVSVLYPVTALSYVWINLLSMKYLGEQMNRWKWLGTALILLGVALIGVGS